MAQTPFDDDQRLRDFADMIRRKVDPALLGLSTEKFSEFIEHVGSSAPRVKTAEGEPLLRWQDAVIEQLIEEEASVLDLGCGNGELLARLMEIKRVRGQGVELDAQAVFQCVERAVPVLQANLDEGLKGFPGGAFDYVVLEETLQTLHQPMEVLTEVLRVGRKAIVTFPNFAYWRVRLDLAIRGRMPVTEWLPYRWYDTPNIHNLTIQDFLDWAAEREIEIIRGIVLCEGQVRELRDGDNLYADEALFVIRRRSGED